jgi:hypothetical protein
VVVVLGADVRTHTVVAVAPRLPEIASRGPLIAGETVFRTLTTPTQATAEPSLSAAA